MFKNIAAAWRVTAILLDIAFTVKHLPVRLLRREIITQEVTFPSDGRNVAANLYRPKDEARHPAVVVGHGFLPIGKDDYRLQLVGKILARAGYVVFVPDLTWLKEERLHPEDVQVLVDSVEYLHSQSFVRTNAVALAGFCVSASLALVAAEDPRINDKVALVSSWGGYYDLQDLFQAIATSSYEYRGRRYPWQPAPNVKAIMAKNLIETVMDPGEREYINAALSAWRGDDRGEPDKSSRELSALGEAILRSLTNGGVEDVDSMWNLLNDEARRDLLAVSPATHIERLKARAFIVHGESDGTVPSIESRKLTEAIADRDRVYYSTFRIFSHVNPEVSRVSLTSLPIIGRDIARFYLYLYQILRHL